MKKALSITGTLMMAAVLTSCGPKTAQIGVSTELLGSEDKVLTLNVDDEGYVVIFDGTSLDGWRGHGKNYVPGKWIIEDGCLKFDSQSSAEGGDLTFAHKFKNFELSIEWKISKAGNSGIMYLGQEVVTTDESGKKTVEPPYISAPECQVLDNENHPDAKLGKDGNRKSTSLYDMIPASPQNANPWGEWNEVKIRVDHGTVTHFQNGVQVVQYKPWTAEWTQMLQASKFSEKAWPLAFEKLNNLGGDNHEGFISLQDHGNDVWYRNIRVKILD